MLTIQEVTFDLCRVATLGYVQQRRGHPTWSFLFLQKKKKTVDWTNGAACQGLGLQSMTVVVLLLGDYAFARPAYDLVTSSRFRAVGKIISFCSPSPPLAVGFFLWKSPTEGAPANWDADCENFKNGSSFGNGRPG